MSMLPLGDVVDLPAEVFSEHNKVEFQAIKPFLERHRRMAVTAAFPDTQRGRHFTRESLAIWVSRKLNSTDVIDVLPDTFVLRSVPGHIRSDDGPDFTVPEVRDWIKTVGAMTTYISRIVLERMAISSRSKPASAIPSSSAGHTDGSAQAHRELTFNPDH
jgi:hypothetical protein